MDFSDKAYTRVHIFLIAIIQTEIRPYFTKKIEQGKNVFVSPDDFDPAGTAIRFFGVKQEKIVIDNRSTYRKKEDLKGH